MIPVPTPTDLAPASRIKITSSPVPPSHTDLASESHTTMNHVQRILNKSLECDTNSAQPSSAHPAFPLPPIATTETRLHIHLARVGVQILLNLSPTHKCYSTSHLQLHLTHLARTCCYTQKCYLTRTNITQPLTFAWCLRSPSHSLSRPHDPAPPPTKPRRPPSPKKKHPQ